MVAVLATLLAPVLLYLVVRGTIAGLSPAAAAQLPPRNYPPMLRPIATASVDPRVQLPKQTPQLVGQAATTSPLAYEPFVLAGRAAADRKDYASAIALMEEARRRRPSSLVARFHLMSYYGQVRRFPELFAEMDFILRSSPQARDRILPELVKLVRDPAGRRALAPLLAKGPEWRSDFFKAAEQQPPSPAAARELMTLVGAAGPEDGLALERGLYLQSLLKAGQPREARSLWLQALPADRRASNALLFDGGFSGMSAPPPFTWTFHDRTSGRAEIMRDGNASYLNAEFFGGEVAILAEQTLALPPGRYRLTFTASSGSGLKAEKLVWSLACGGSEAGRVELGGLSNNPRRISGEIQVPSGCTGQTLRFLIEPGDISTPIDVRIDDLRVTPA